MLSYIIRRLLLIPITMFGILLITFPIIQLAPGGPVEQYMAELENHGGGALERLTGQSDSVAVQGSSDGQLYRGDRGVPNELREQIKKQFGFDKPLHERFINLILDYLTFDFGRSYYKDKPVIDLIIDKLPVSISLGLWMTILTYIVALPLGIAKAVREGSRFDTYSSIALVIGFAIPTFLLAVLLIVLFAGGHFWTIFPRTGLYSDGFDELSLLGKVADYFWHLVLPLLAMSVGAFTTTAFLVKNSFLDEIHKPYVMTARAKGLSESGVLYGHVFRNALLIVIASFPSAFISAFFAGSLLIELTFGLDGLGLLGFEAIRQRDFPIIFANIYIFGLLGLCLKLVSDITYALVDPRIDFEKRAN